jgi:hypothetical protein
MSDWTEEELKQLEDPEHWDSENALAFPGGQARGAVVAVRFDRSDFPAIARAAQQAGIPLTQFIHDAALARARGGSLAPMPTE